MCAVPTSPSLVSAAVSPLHAPCSAAPVPIRRPRSRAQWLVTRLSGLRFAVCCDVFAPTVESGVVPVPGPSTLKSPAKGCSQLAQRKHAKRCMTANDATPQEDRRFACGGWKRRGSVQGYWGGGHWCRRICHQNCTWPTVVGVSARGVRSWAVVRLLQGPIAHGSTWDEEGGKISSPLGDRSGVFQCPGVDGGPVMLLSGWLTAGCNFRRNGWDMLFIWVCAGE